MSDPVDELFHKVVDLAPEARARYFAESNVDEAMRREVESLLAFDSTGEPLTGRVENAAGKVLPRLESGNGRCGPYRLLNLVGRGGMGVVYLAERVDGEVAQRVAVKLLPIGAGEMQRERFLKERQILATLSHPNIARLLDAGHSVDQRPYLAMEYVDGIPIDSFANALPTNRKLELFLKVCAAASYMHRNLIIHRDLKPGNILVTAEGEPKLLDFGIAKLLDLATDSTATGWRMMTPDYASPEQVTGKDLTTATDVYSLGAVLYRLLTGSTVHQFDSHHPEAIASVVAGSQITRPSERAPELKGDLEIILLKALKQDPQERYATVEQFAEDLSRYLRNEPITARPDSLVYKSRKFASRHRTGIAAAIVALLALVVGTGVAVWQASESARQRNLALSELRRAEATNDFSSYLLSQARPSGGKAISNSELLARGEALIDSRFSTDREIRIHLLITLADRYYENQQFADRARVLRKAYDESAAVADLGLRSYAACQWASQSAERGDFKQAFTLLDGALSAIFNNPDYAASESRCRVIESVASYQSADASRAVLAGERAVVLEDQRGGALATRMEALSALAAAYSGSYRFEEMDKTYARSVELLEKQGGANTRDMSVQLNNWSSTLQDAGQMLRAVSLAERAVRVARAVDSEHGASLNMLLTYGSALMAVGRYPDADNAFEEAIVKARIAGSPRRQITTAMYAIDAACEARDFKRSERLLADARAILAADRSASDYSRGLVEVMEARLALEKGDSESAVETAQRARGTLEKATPTKASLERALDLLARSLNVAGRYREALPIAEQSVSTRLARASHVKHSYQMGKALLELATARAGLGELDDARVKAAAALEHSMQTAGPYSRITQRAQALCRKLGLP